MVNKICKGRAAVSVQMAQRLALALATSPEFWLNLQQACDLHLAEPPVGVRVLVQR
jgi:addiction module HigA family antidote